MARFRKKPVEIEAVSIHTIMSWAYGNAVPLDDWVAAAVEGERPPVTVLREAKLGVGPGIVIKTLEGEMFGAPEDFLIRGVKGELYPCKPDIFEGDLRTGGATSGRPADSPLMGLVMLDLDGTLVEDAIVELENPDSSKGFTLGRRQHELYSEPTLKPHVYETLQELAEAGDAFAIVTNQGGVALGYHTQAEVYARIARTAALLSMFWGQPFSVHVAWMMPKGYLPGFKGDDGRKPASTMLDYAMLAHGTDGTDLCVNPGPVVMVGDRDEDEQAAAAAGVAFTPAFQFFSW